MMTVHPDHVGALRAFLIGDSAEFERLSRQHVASLDHAYGILFSVAFVKTIRRHFGDQCHLADIIRYVADLRSRQHLVDDVDPRIAERLIRTGMGDVVDTDMDAPATRAQIQLAILDDLVRKRRMEAEELELFLTEVRHEADQNIQQIRR